MTQSDETEPLFEHIYCSASLTINSTTLTITPSYFLNHDMPTKLVDGTDTCACAIDA